LEAGFEGYDECVEDCGGEEPADVDEKAKDEDGQITGTPYLIPARTVSAFTG